jgi:hypothetical protein
MGKKSLRSSLSERARVDSPVGEMKKVPRMSQGMNGRWLGGLKNMLSDTI